MKRLLGIILVAFALMAIPSCKEGMDWNNVKLKLQDSIFAALPTCQAIHLTPDNDGTHLIIVVGDITLYKAPHDQQVQKAQQIAKMVLRVVGENNYLDKGTFTITSDIHNDVDNPKDGIAIPVDFAALKKGGLAEMQELNEASKAMVKP